MDDDIEIMERELGRVDGIVRAAWLANERVIAIGTGLLGAAALFASSNPDSVHPVLVGLPFALAGVYAYGLDLQRELISQAAWKSVIERRLENRVPGLRLQWDSEIAPKVIVRSGSQVVVYGFFFVTFIVSVVISMFVLWDKTEVDLGWQVGLSGSLATILAGLIWSMLDGILLAAGNVRCVAYGRANYKLRHLVKKEARKQFAREGALEARVTPTTPERGD